MAYCQECGGWFPRQASERWKVLCLECWKERKRGEMNRVTHRRQPPRGGLPGGGDGGTCKLSQDASEL